MLIPTRLGGLARRGLVDLQSQLYTFCTFSKVRFDVFHTKFLPGVLLGLKDFCFVSVFKFLKACAANLSKDCVVACFDSVF